VSDLLPFRKTSQYLMPAQHLAKPGQYQLYPGFPLNGPIGLGFEALAEQLPSQKQVVLEGFVGVLWQDFRGRLDQALRARGLQVEWLDVDSALKPAAQLETLLEPFLGGDDPLFGRRFSGTIADFFDAKKLSRLQPSPDADLSILYGPGASLAGWEGLLVYVDLPKNELQFRARAGVPTNLGLPLALSAKAAYKRSYFVDWPVLNAHKALLLERVEVFVDAQRPDEISFASGDSVRAALEQMGKNFFRVRPWFEPGPWGGQWIKQQIPQLAQDVPNYAWSFELITPENGLVLEQQGRLLEVSFDWLMYHQHQAVLGQAAERFGFEFPIRFDWLDTLDGGNLSLQCHPRPDYAQQHFGEPFTQDETYYMLDCKPGASVYLGFQEDIQALEFRTALEASQSHNTPLEVGRFVQRHPAHKHDLFLIPNQTIHCAGEGCVVLEISATPYIFTFKMYDWLRLDLEGKPRPLNIGRAFENLDFGRKGKKATAELIAKPYVLKEGQGWRVVHLPTHPEHFYDVHRLEFDREISLETSGQCHVLAVVEGSGVRLETAQGMQQCFMYAETFVVSAAAGRYRLVNQGGHPVKVIKAFVKTEAR
jgi:mannose-6-phosphate isomerase class I